MATPNKYFIAEQVLFRLYGGHPDDSSPVQQEDVWAALAQKCNAKFKMEQFSVDMAAGGGAIPNGAMLAYYENIPVTSLNNGQSKCELPVVPISLPRSIGVFEITDSENRNSFIPIAAGQRILLKSQPLINDLLGQIGYEQRGKYIYFSKDLTLLKQYKVNMTLAVFDISQYDTTDPLPIPADQLDTIINELVVQFSPVSPEAGMLNNYTIAGQNQQAK